MPRICFYITSHGFGHSTREIEVISHIPNCVDVEIVTAAPEWLFERSLHRPFSYFELLHDPGIVQIDSLQQDVSQTRVTWERLLDQYPAMIQNELNRFRKNGTPDLVIGDISPFTIPLAEAVGVPSVIVANFSWDWIFSVFLKYDTAFQSIIDRIAEYYKRTSLLLRTPLCGDLSVFPNIVDIPLVARRSSLSQVEARELFDLSEEEDVVLISFGGLGFDRLSKERLAAYPDVTFLTFDQRLTGPKNVWLLDKRETYHPDAVQACDLALVKLGYGIVTECIAHQTPMAFPPRMDFPEQDVMREEIVHHIKTIEINESDFFAGNWDFLTDFFSTDGKDKSETGGASTRVDGGEQAARILFERLG